MNEDEKAFYLKDLIRFNARRGFSAWMMGIDYFRCIEYSWALYFLSQGTGKTILDLGSGASLFPYYLAFRGDSVVCTDLNYEQATTIGRKALNYLLMFANASPFKKRM